MEISFVISTRNNLEYLKWSYASIRRNQGDHTVYLCYGLDACNDGTQDWIEEIKKSDPQVLSIENASETRVGHTIMYDRIVNELVKTDLALIFHSDMYLCPGALDSIEKLMYDGMKSIGFIENKKRIASLTRIEPKLHPGGVEKILSDFGQEPSEFDEAGLSAQLLVFEKLDWWEYTDSDGRKFRVPLKGATEGVFAPFAFWASEFKEIGGHDSLFAPQSKEDSDIFNRFKLNGTEFVHTREGFVYHLTCRGSRFAPSLTTPGKNSQEWETQNIKSSRNFIRKWGHFVKHDEYLNPIIPHKYNIGFVIKNCTYNQLYNLEIWCDSIKVDLENEIIDRYIEFEQFNTKFDLTKKLLDHSKIPDIVVEMDGSKLTQDDYNNIQNLSEIISLSCDGPGEYQLGSMKLNVRSLTHYEKDLIVCKN